MAKSEIKDTNRLDKCVSHLTGLSRQQATKLIKDGAVRVDGELILKAMTKVSLHSQIVIEGYNDESEEILMPEQDEASASGSEDNTLLESAGTKVADAFKKRVFLMNKPYGYVCSERDRNHAIVSSLWGRELFSSKLQAVGRLDVDTTGLLLFTDDGALNHTLTSPKKQVSKLYLARLNRPVPPKAVEQFARGIKHPEESKRYQSAKLTIFPPFAAPSSEDYLQRTAAAADAAADVTASGTEGEERAEPNPCYWAAVLLSEGRYHEVKRLFEVVGCEVQELVRVAMGSLLLPNDLALGEYIPLSDEQIVSAMHSRDFSYEELLELLQRYQHNLSISKLIYLRPEHAAILVQARKASAVTPSETDAAGAGDAAGAAGTIAAGDGAAPVVSEDSFSDDADYFDKLDENGELRIY